MKNQTVLKTSVRLALLVKLCLLLTLSSFAQKTVTGRVTDSRTNAGLGGVSVQVKGSSTGTTTDDNGSFSISAPSANSILVFTYTGMTSQEIRVGDQTAITLAL